MSKQYDEYLIKHIQNVQKGIEWLIGHGLVDDDAIDILAKRGKLHDMSKYTAQEYDAYDDYFYLKDKNDPEVKEAFNYAWLNHIHNNKHHWQYWVLINDDDGIKPLEIPKEYVYEMIADWMSFSIAKDDMKAILDWYDQHEKKMILHPETRKLVDSIMDRIAKETEGEEDA